MTTAYDVREIYKNTFIEIHYKSSACGCKTFFPQEVKLFSSSEIMPTGQRLSNEKKRKLGEAAKGCASISSLFSSTSKKSRYVNVYLGCFQKVRSLDDLRLSFQLRKTRPI